MKKRLPSQARPRGQRLRRRPRGEARGAEPRDQRSRAEPRDQRSRAEPRDEPRQRPSHEATTNKTNCFVFIDSQNLNLAILDQGWRLDFARFRRYLKDKFKIEKAFLFIGYIPGNEGLYASLQKAGFILIFKPTLEVKREGKLITKGNVDAELVLHAMIEYPNYSKAIIVSGDGDFHCLIEYLEQQKKLLRVLVPNQYKYSALLRKFQRHIVFLGSLKNKLGYKNEGH
ncbi:MAG: NYN domain-containing protein [Patescibacteria group bacterium]